MRAAVTGGTGFIGGHLIKKLLEGGFQVRCLVRNQSKGEKLAKQGVEIYKGDLSNPDTLKDLVKDCEYVFHIAAFVSDWGSKEDFFKINVTATKALLSYSLESNVKRFIHMSSSTVVWKSTFWDIHNLQDITELYPYPEKYNDFYNESKAEAEKVVVNFYKEQGLETVVIRPSNVWGAGDTVILPRIAMAARKKILIPMGFCKKIVTPCNIDNLVHGIMLAAESENSIGKVYFINDGLKIDYVTFVRDQLNSIGIEWEPMFKIPYRVGYSIAGFMEFVFKLLRSKKPPVLTRFAVAALSGSRSYSIARAKKDLNFSPVISYDEGMQKMSTWIKNIGGVEKLLGD